MSINEFQIHRIPASAERLRGEVRAFIRETLGTRPRAAQSHSWMGFDDAFSRALGRRGWIGITLPETYGGAGLTQFDRYVVLEELLAVGAPVSAHWIADRQTGPLILKFGSETQKAEHLPAICRGERYFCIGMSEPDSGSDLASIASRAEPDEDGWILNGRKIWTTNAHRSHFVLVLARTAKSDHRHRGMSQFIVDLTAPGVEVRPVVDLTGDAHFNEIVFTDVRLGPDALLGKAGDGWNQVMAELAFERSGPDRFLSAFAGLAAMTDQAAAAGGLSQTAQVGRFVARLVVLRQMSLAVTGRLAAAENPSWAASCVKDFGVTFEQELLDVAGAEFEFGPGGASKDDVAAVGYLTQIAPAFSLRGGTREVLRGIIARGLGLR